METQTQPVMSKLKIVPSTTEIRVIRREVASHIPITLAEGVKKSIGSFFVANSYYRPLDFEEEQLLLPGVIGVSHQDPTFVKEVAIFWQSFTVQVPFGGLRLNLLMTEDGMPFNIVDYLKWRFLYSHKKVAKNIEEFNRDYSYDVYLFDPSEESRKQNRLIKIRTNANLAFAKIMEDRVRLAQIIRMLGKVSPEGMTLEQMQNRASLILEDNPDLFATMVNDKKLATTAFIEDSIDKEVFKKYGNTIMYGDITLGESYEEVSLFLNSAKNSQVILSIKARYKEASKDTTLLTGSLDKTD